MDTSFTYFTREAFMVEIISQRCPKAHTLIQMLRVGLRKSREVMAPISKGD